MEKNIIIIIISRIIGCEHLEFRIETENLFKDCWLNAKSQKVSQARQRQPSVASYIDYLMCFVKTFPLLIYMTASSAHRAKCTFTGNYHRHVENVVRLSWFFLFICLCIFWHQKEDFPDIWIGSNAFCAHKHSSDAIWLNFLKYYTSFDFVITARATLIKSYLYTSLVVSRKC